MARSCVFFSSLSISHLTKYSAIDRLQLVLRNALQILDIVKATFPNEVHNAVTGDADCDQPESAGAELACLWSTANISLAAGDESHISSSKDAVRPLFKVSSSARPWLLELVSNTLNSFVDVHKTS
jgi:ethanolaminephosphotransferase